MNLLFQFHLLHWLQLHYLFYELEERLKRPFIHGNIIGLGIYLLSRLQKNDPLFITEMMDESGLIYHPNSMNIKREDLRESLLTLKNYVKSKDKLWFTIILPQLSKAEGNCL